MWQRSKRKGKSLSGEWGMLGRFWGRVLDNFIPPQSMPRRRDLISLLVENLPPTAQYIQNLDTSELPYDMAVLMQNSNSPQNPDPDPATSPPKKPGGL
jgi:hypothetical protein